MEVVANQDGKVVEIRMLRPADMHQHVRDDELLQTVVPLVARRFHTAIIMPNTIPPITTGEMVAEYRTRIYSASKGYRFEPLMTAYLTDKLDPKLIGDMLSARGIYGVKYYPRGLTTNSDSGVEKASSLWTKGTRPYEVLRAIAAQGGVLLLHAADGFDKHGEELDPYEQEEHFLTVTLPHIVDGHPNLKISVEHLSTATGADEMRHYGRTTNGRVGCSLTAHHLLLDRRNTHKAGLRPHLFWWPIIQSKEDRDELRKFAAEGHPFVFLGSDSAPHPVDKKQADCCVGGVLMAHAGIELYVEAFEEMGALDKFEAFASINGPRFYGIQPSIHEIKLVKKPWKVREWFYAGANSAPVRPFRLGEEVQWQLAD